MASFSVPCPKSSNSSPSRRGASPHQNHRQLRQSRISYNPALNSTPSTLVTGSSSDGSAVFGFQKQSDRKPVVWKVHAQPKEGNDHSVENASSDVSSISAFMSQVGDIVKLVDSRDIVELHLKQQDCELVIRKKEALQQPPAAPAVMVQPSPPSSAPLSAPAAAPSPATSSAPQLALPSPAQTSKSSHPPLKCPMAGTFYRSPSPGEPPFVKVGDKVQKGQAICIIEAMKLMNEIEADHSGTITEILVEDGKPVSVDMPLLVISP